MSSRGALTLVMHGTRCSWPSQDIVTVVRRANGLAKHSRWHVNRMAPSRERCDCRPSRQRAALTPRDFVLFGQPTLRLCSWVIPVPKRGGGMGGAAASPSMAVLGPTGAGAVLAQRSAGDEGGLGPHAWTGARRRAIPWTRK